jgi:hypothetical protein
MRKELAELLVDALEKRGVRAWVDDNPSPMGEPQVCVVIRDTRDTVWWSQHAGWSWGPNFEHTVYANAPVAEAADRIVAERKDCRLCAALLPKEG